MLFSKGAIIIAKPFTIQKYSAIFDVEYITNLKVVPFHSECFDNYRFHKTTPRYSAASSS